jgi:hypothetical protein
MTQTCHNCRWWIRIESTPMGGCHLDPFVMRSTGEKAKCPNWEGPPVTFEASLTIGNGGVTARLDPAANRVEIETHNDPAPADIAAALPRVLEHLATRSGLPVRYGGKIYLPRPIRRQDADLWGAQ